MRREASIPLFLWAAMAILAHLTWGGGAEQVARVNEERLDVGRFAAGIRSHVKGSIAPPIEIALDDESTPEDEAKPEEKEPDEDADENVKDDTDEAPEDIKEKPKPPKKLDAKPEEP